MDPFDAASPFDARYFFADRGFFERLSPFVTEKAQIRYLARVEAALAETLAEQGVMGAEAAAEIAAAAAQVSPEEVYQEEERIQHNIRALVNCIRRRVSDSAKPFVHLFATSADVMDTARALALKDVTARVILPDLAALVEELADLAEQHATTLQMGRTHGQHAVPITFGFAVALYVSRLGQRWRAIREASDNLRGKFAGAVGAYNALSLLQPTHPEKLEERLMQRLGLRPPEISSQVVQPEYTADFVHSLASAWGVLANLADDFRHLQRSEIREIRDRRGSDPSAKIVGSSTMPHKINPKDFENVKSMWKAYVPRVLTVLMDQISEHQRDLTNSASMRFVVEFAAAFAYGIHRTRGALRAIEPDVERMRAILEEGKDAVAAEPLYILLALFGHPDAHEAARVLAAQARREKQRLVDVIAEAPDIQPYLAKLTAEQREVLRDPSRYIGAAAERTRAVCRHWRQELAAARSALEV